MRSAIDAAMSHPWRQPIVPSFFIAESAICSATSR
jgi:hypothetical protein